MKEADTRGGQNKQDQTNIQAIEQHRHLIQREFDASFMAEVGMRLPAMQERFCELFIKYGNATKAYKEAYPNNSGTDKSICEAASKLKAKANIKIRIEQLRKLAICGAVMSRYEVLTRLTEIARSGAKDRGKALELLAKYHDLLSAESIAEIGISDCMIKIFKN